MRAMTLAEIEKAVNGKIISGNENEKILNICTDSRKAKEGDLFVPIIGEVHDAHKFIPSAAENGCRAFLISKAEAAPEGAAAVLTDDTTAALQALSAWYLDTLHLKKIAVTGSVGKTSTRDMVYYILKEKYVTGTTTGNFNNDIGVPLTIFTFDESMEAAVLETGMDHFGEIHRLVDIIRPDIGIITNVGVSHIENLGSREGILKAKMEITDYFGKDNCLVVNAANDMLAAADFSGAYTVIKAGTSPEDDFFVHDIEDFGEEGIVYKLTAGGAETEIRLSVPGAHNAVNSALAAAACLKLGVTLQQAADGLAKLQLTGKRLTVKEAGGIKLIDDTYNAAPDSVKSAIDTLMHTKGSRKIAILGGMNELGEDSALHHREVGRYAAEQKADMLIAIGEKAFDIAEGCRETGGTEVLSFETKDRFYEAAAQMFRAGDVIMVKGSRTMEMEQVVDRIMKEQE